MYDKTINVWLIEDNPDYAVLIREALAESKDPRFNLRCFDLVSEGLEHLFMGGIEIVLLDLSLPGSQGLDAFTRIHTDAADVPIVLLVDLDDERLAAQAAKQGAQDYLLKSQFNGPLLCRSIRYAVERHSLLRESARQVSENSRLSQDLRASMEEMTVVNEIARIITSTLNIDQVYEQFALEMKKLVDFDRVGINTVNHEDATFTVRYVYGQIHPTRPLGTPIPLAGTEVGEIVKTGKTVRRADLTHELKFSADTKWADLKLNSGIIIPLISKGTVMGTFSLRSRRFDAYGPPEQEVLERLAKQIAPAIENARLYEEARRAEKHNQRLHAFNDRIISSIPSALAVLKGDQRLVVSMNPACQKAFGLTSDEVVGKPIREVLPLEELTQTILEILECGKPGRQTEIRYTASGQDARWFEVSATPLQTETEAEIEALLILNDVTEQKQQQEQLQETRRLASVGQLAAGVSHEINNPLTAVLGFSLLALNADLSKEVRSDIERVHTQAERASKIVQNLLSFARKHEPERQYLRVATVLDRALELKSYDFRTNHIEVSREWSPELPATSLDEHQMVQVILNILTNAEQAMVESHGKGHLRVRAISQGNNIRISISDDGPGIPPEYLKRVFEPFFTTKEVGQGTGLGLSICYGLVQQHGGKLWGESPPGNGATFHLEIPIVNPEDSLEASKNGTGQFDGKIAKRLTTKHLMVVDDEPDIRDLLARSLELEPYTVDLAENGQEAWRKLQGRPYDCVIMDLKMPVMSGPELYRLIEESLPELAQKVIFITGDNMNPETSAFISSVDNQTMAKPFNMKELQLRIRTLLQETRHSRGYA
jgi:two-component system NtrC family sensor kinase